MIELPDFVECDTCRAKPGAPTLCTGCLHNRQLILELKYTINQLIDNAALQSKVSMADTSHWKCVVGSDSA